MNVKVEHWATIGFDDAFEQISTTGKTVKTAGLPTEGSYPVIDQGKAPLAGFLDSPELVISNESPVIIFGDHTRAVKWVDSPFIPGADGLKVLALREPLDARFFYYHLRSLNLESKGYARHFSQVRDATYCLPPLAEQKRIAQKLDALLAQVDTLKARIDAIPALLKRFRLSILTAATSGTTFDGSSVITNQSEANGSSFMLNDETFDLPKGWSHAPVDSVLHSARRLCYGVVQPGSEVESGVDMIRVCDIEDGTIAWNDLRKIASEVDDEYRRSRVQRGDVLMSIVGSIGRAAIVREDRPANIARAVARLSVDQSQLTPEWLFLWLTSPKVQWWLVSSSKEVARKTLNLKELSELPVPLPPKEVQAEIVRRVDQLFAYADQLEAKVATAQQRIDALTQSLLAKAFRGELVPQDPGDEPASVLLERIRTQRAATPKPKRGRKAATS
ncbi:restriction endonuclease subunit S [Xanthomonas campestris]|uniref:restriction endonuclease subunit S n=1 Tax=Xanthomonas campestris TaxID=339 RepID=UPI000E749EE5|nr:restriction endonuclease subunit S [Xanthomonas campestris]RJU12063.1 restriction endonuclease subunit S [Xanthomonas campestris]